MKKKDGKIELLRFLMTIMVILFHINGDGLIPWDTLFFHNFTLARWSNAVEFFFLLSSMLMTKTIWKRVSDEETGKLQPEPIGVETARYIIRKFKGLLPYYLFYNICMMVYDYLYYPDYSLNEMLHYYAIRLQSLFFLSSFGLTGSVDAFLGVSWYLSSMLIAMAIVYPLCRKYYKTFTHLIAPLSAAFIYGYLMHSHSDITSGGAAWLGFTYLRNLRAVAGVALGTTCYEVSQWLFSVRLTNCKRLLVTLLEYGCYICALLLFVSNYETSPRIYNLALFAIGLTLTFSRQSYFTDSKFFNNRVVYYLGSGSYSIYLIQNFTRCLIPDTFTNCSGETLVVMVLVSTIVFGLLVYEGGQQLKRFLAIRNAKAVHTQ